MIISLSKSRSMLDIPASIFFLILLKTRLFVNFWNRLSSLLMNLFESNVLLSIMNMLMLFLKVFHKNMLKLFLSLNLSLIPKLKVHKLIVGMGPLNHLLPLMTLRTYLCVFVLNQNSVV